MAGHYVPMDHELPDKPEVAGIFERTDCEIGTICGRLFLYWSLADRQSVNGILLNMGIRGLCAKCGGDAEFWKAVEEVGWLRIVPEGIEVPGFEQRFSKSARERRQGWERQKRYRDRNGERYESVTDVTPNRNAGVCPEPKTETVTETIKPEPSGVGLFTKRFRSAAKHLADDCLKDTGKVLSLLPADACEADKLFCLAAAERATEIGKKPVALFVKYIRDNDRSFMAIGHTDRAYARLKAHNATGPPQNGYASAAIASAMKPPR